MIDKIHVAALVDRLIYGSNLTFARADAIALYEVIPHDMRRTRWADWLQISGKADFPTGTASGVSPGHGDIRVDGDSKTFEFDTGGRRVLRAGQWKIYPMGSTVRLEQVMASGLDERRTASIHYLAGEPVRMDILVPTTLSLGFLSLTFSTYKPWKRVGQ